MIILRLGLDVLVEISNNMLEASKFIIIYYIV